MRITDKIRLDFIDRQTSNTIVMADSPVTLDLKGRPFFLKDDHLKTFKTIRLAIDAAIRASKPRGKKR
jgi:pyrimidine operon attenuation protein/uracil phosphoribosyltransferase